MGEPLAAMFCAANQMFPAWTADVRMPRPFGTKDAKLLMAGVGSLMGILFRNWK